jgi:TolA-binding protein
MKRIAAIILGVFLLTPGAFAEEKKDKGFWENLKAKVEKLQPTRKTPETTAVGGVRGAKDHSAEDLYWKGEEEKGEIKPEELDAFSAGIDKASEGKKDEAVKLFEEFVNKYPKSRLKEDATKAIGELKAEK